MRLFFVVKGVQLVVSITVFCLLIVPHQLCGQSPFDRLLSNQSLACATILKMKYFELRTVLSADGMNVTRLFPKENPKDENQPMEKTLEANNVTIVTTADANISKSITDKNNSPYNAKSGVVVVDNLSNTKNGEKLFKQSNEKPIAHKTDVFVTYAVRNLKASDSAIQSNHEGSNYQIDKESSVTSLMLPKISGKNTTEKAITKFVQRITTKKTAMSNSVITAKVHHENNTEVLKIEGDVALTTIDKQSDAVDKNSTSKKVISLSNTWNKFVTSTEMLKISANTTLNKLTKLIVEPSETTPQISTTKISGADVEVPVTPNGYTDKNSSGRLTALKSGNDIRNNNKAVEPVININNKEVAKMKKSKMNKPNSIHLEKKAEVSVSEEEKVNSTTASEHSVRRKPDDTAVSRSNQTVVENAEVNAANLSEAKITREVLLPISQTSVKTPLPNNSIDDDIFRTTSKADPNNLSKLNETTNLKGKENQRSGSELKEIKDEATAILKTTQLSDHEGKPIASIENSKFLKLQANHQVEFSSQSCIELSLSDWTCIRFGKIRLTPCEALAGMIIPPVLVAVDIGVLIFTIYSVFSSPIQPSDFNNLTRCVLHLMFWILSASVLSLVLWSWSKSWTHIGFEPNLPSYWIAAFVLSLMMVMSYMFEFLMGDIYYKNIRLVSNYGRYQLDNEFYDEEFTSETTRGTAGECYHLVPTANN